MEVLKNNKLIIPTSMLSVLIGGISWLTSLHFSVQAQADKIAKIEERQKDNRKELRSDLQRLEGKVDRLILFMQRSTIGPSRDSR